MKINNQTLALILFAVFATIFMNCSVTKRVELYRINNENYVIICYRIYTPATDPLQVEITAIDLFKNRDKELLLARVIRADSANMEFISNDSIYIEFFSSRFKEDSTVTLDLSEENDLIKFQALYD